VVDHSSRSRARRSCAPDDDSTYQSRLTSSYDNGLTNIAPATAVDSRRDAMAAPSLSIYVEGVGTRDDADDDLIGLAFGIGASGVRPKCSARCRCCCRLR
jgi:hypothetical protein